MLFNNLSWSVIKLYIFMIVCTFSSKWTILFVISINICYLIFRECVAFQQHLKEMIKVVKEWLCNVEQELLHYIFMQHFCPDPLTSSFQLNSRRTFQIPRLLLVFWTTFTLLIQTNTFYFFTYLPLIPLHNQHLLFASGQRTNMQTCLFACN